MSAQISIPSDLYEHREDQLHDLLHLIEPSLFDEPHCTDDMVKAATEILRERKSADDIIQELEAKGLGWSLDHCGALIEARIWQWPTVVGRYRPNKVEPLADMLSKARNNMNTLRAESGLPML
jgi:hypothetical protein